MLLMTLDESKQALGVKDLDQYLSSSNVVATKRKSYYLPKTSADQTILARAISAFVLNLGESWVQITYWNNDLDSNQELFYGYRKGHGDNRSLAEASIYLFKPGEAEELGSILCMALYFAWDVRLFDSGPTYLVLFNNDGFVDYKTTSSIFATGVEQEFSISGLQIVHKEHLP